jgi:hypothetical protein
MDLDFSMTMLGAVLNRQETLIRYRHFFKPIRTSRTMQLAHIFVMISSSTIGRGMARELATSSLAFDLQNIHVCLQLLFAFRTI